MCNAIHLLVGERGMKHYPLYPMFIPLITQKSIICWCGSMVEQLTCNQQVEGSIPFTSSKTSTLMGALNLWADCRAAKCNGL